jgi:anti-sigma regulatory factor (Ser/Thr protein kinase)
VLQVRAEGDSPPYLSHRFAAKAECGSLLRVRLREWLEETGATEDEIFDFQLACSEALALILGCESRPVALVVDVKGKIDGEVVSVRIRDYGLSRQRRELDDGLGVWLLRGMMDRVEVAALEDGYAIELTRALTGYGTRPAAAHGLPPLAVEDFLADVLAEPARAGA